MPRQSLDRYGLDALDLSEWHRNRVTQAVFQMLRDQFDFAEALRGSADGVTIDRLKGRAEVLDFVMHISTRAT
ncbi:MAG: hypothetical protein ACREXR_14565 [Gammaproteobacteria bacterium]